MGRLIDWNFLDSINFEYGSYLKEICPSWILNPDTNIYENVVRIFFNNIKRMDNDCVVIDGNITSCSFKSYFDGQIIKVSPKMICREADLCWTEYEDCAVYLNTEILMDAKIVFNNDNLEFFSTNATDLNFQERVLHFLIIHVIKPRARNYTSITRDDFWLMARIIERKNEKIQVYIFYFLIL